jgi:hypothetical protein
MRSPIKMKPLLYDTEASSQGLNVSTGLELENESGTRALGHSGPVHPMDSILLEAGAECEAVNIHDNVQPIPLRADISMSSWYQMTDILVLNVRHGHLGSECPSPQDSLFLHPA